MIEHRRVCLWEGEQKKERTALVVVYECFGIHDQSGRKAWQIDRLLNDCRIVVQETAPTGCTTHVSLYNNNRNKSVEHFI